MGNIEGRCLCKRGSMWFSVLSEVIGYLMCNIQR